MVGIKYRILLPSGNEQHEVLLLDTDSIYEGILQAGPQIHVVQIEETH